MFYDVLELPDYGRPLLLRLVTGLETAEALHTSRPQKTNYKPAPCAVCQPTRRSTMSHRIEQLNLPTMWVGEGPHWLEAQQALVVLDVRGKLLRKYYVETGNTEVLRIDGGKDKHTVNMAVPVEGTEDLWVVGLGNTLSVVRWPSSQPDSHTFLGHTTTPSTIHTVPDDHFNDGKCDPRGRLWAGTMSDRDKNRKPLHPGSCHLYRCDHNLDLTACVKDLTLSNGMTWSSDRKHFYFVDSTSLCVYHFDYDDEAGAVSNQRVLLNFKEAGLQNQGPDGMTIDQNDNLWVASIRGGQVLCVDPRRGEVVRKVAIPANCTTSVCWGGRDYSTLFVTSGNFDLPDQPPSAGGTFAIKGLGVKGSPPMSFKADLTKLRAKMEV